MAFLASKQHIVDLELPILNGFVGHSITHRMSTGCNFSISFDNNDVGRNIAGNDNDARMRTYHGVVHPRREMMRETSAPRVPNTLTVG